MTAADLDALGAIDAFQMTHEMFGNEDAEWPEWAQEACESGLITMHGPDDIAAKVRTLGGGIVDVAFGDWIFRNAKGSLCVCRPDIDSAIKWLGSLTQWAGTDLECENDKHAATLAVTVRAFNAELTTLRAGAAEAARLREARTVKVSVQPMRCTNGDDFFVAVECGGREVTPYAFKEKFKADYEADFLRWVFEGGERPDILAYGPPTAGGG